MARPVCNHEPSAPRRSGRALASSFAMIRTAIPFGYLFIALFLFAAFVLGLVVFIWGLCRHSRLARWLGGSVVVAVPALVAAEMWFDSAQEWNPTIGSDSEIVGTYADRRETITLAPDKSFTYCAGSQISTGTWGRDDWNLYLTNSNHSSTLRFIQFRGRYRLLTHPPEDPDQWNGDLGLQKIQH
jgi:hypothetical protein